MPSICPRGKSKYAGPFKNFSVVIDINLTFHQHVDTICKYNLIYQVGKVLLENSSWELIMFMPSPLSHMSYSYGLKQKRILIIVFF